MSLTRILLVPAVALSLLMMSPGETIAAECKTLQKSKCEKASQCTYVKGYTTKAGTKVSAYCRNKGKSSSKSSKSSDKNR